MKTGVALLAVSVTLGLLTGCAGIDPELLSALQSATESYADVSPQRISDGTTEEELPELPAEKNGDVMILFTSDMHCGIDQGFGLAGVKQVRDTLEEEGYTTLLVDNGDAIQGEAIGTLSQGEVIVRLMNEAGYDVAIPGNHEFDYGMDCFLALAGLADYPYISCNFCREEELVFAPYVIREAAGKKIAFVGVTTPKSIVSATPADFQDENGVFIYSFLQDESGEALYAGVQQAVDDARKEGADYVYVMAHLGREEDCTPWTYADVISHTSGIDVMLDGHSHDTEQAVVKNKDGDPVVRLACGTKLSGIGYSHIGAQGGIEDNGLYSWTNKESPEKLLGVHNEMTDTVNEAMESFNEELNSVVACSAIELTINDPTAVDNEGLPIRMVRRAETNLGDFCADAILEVSGADISIMNGGGIRKSIKAGDVTYGDIISVFPFGNALSVIEVTGQQILDALEWGVKNVPGENGGFLQVAGMSYEVDITVPSPCQMNESKMFAGVQGERRVKDVLIAGEPLDPESMYTLAGMDYTLLDNGDGFTMFDGASVLQDRVKLDNQILIDYIQETLGGEIGGEYADPYGQGRIMILGD